MDIKNIRIFREQMRQLQRSMGWLAKSDTICCGITVAQCHILMEIGREETIPSKELAAKLGLDTSTISRTLDLMVRNDLVSRQPRRSDRRYLDLTLTARGSALYNNINNIYDKYYLNVFESIPPEK